MIEIIPERVIKSCDRCKAVVNDDFACKGELEISGRDVAGHFVGGYTLKVELCDSCKFRLEKFMEGE